MRKIKKLLAPSNHPESLGSKFRSKRFLFFEEIFNKEFENEKSIKILDVGGTESFWEDKMLIHTKGIHITLLNIQQEAVSTPNIRSVCGDATDLSQFGDQSFDLVFSNSVIEHLHNKENQEKMAAEIQRVGKKYFVQTPNKYFFIEPHYALPFFQFVPDSIGYLILTKTKISRMRKWDPDQAKMYLEEIRLLSCNEFKSLFPNAKIYKEKFFGMNKSFTAYNF